MDEQSQNTVKQLIEQLGNETRPSAASERKTSQGWPRVVFKALSFRQFLRRDGSFLILCGVMLMFSLVSIVLFCVVQPEVGMIWIIATGGLLLSIPLGMILWHLASIHWLAQKGKIILEHDKLVEYTLFNHTREFAYVQIYEVVVRSKQPRIRYYMYNENGKFDRRHIRQAYLIDVHNSAKMVEELQRRIAAPQPSRRALSRFYHRTFGKPTIVTGGSSLLVIALGAGIKLLPIEARFQGILVLLLIGVWMVIGARERLILRMEKRWQGGIEERRSVNSR